MAFSRRRPNTPSCLMNVGVRARRRISQLPDEDGLLFPDDLAMAVQRPQHVKVLGCVPAERSTLDFSVHNDEFHPDLTVQITKRPKTLYENIGNAEPLPLSSEWMPMVQCNPYVSVPGRQRLVNQDLGFAWCMGDARPTAVVLHCMRTSDATTPGTLRFWRAGVVGAMTEDDFAIDVVPLPEPAVADDDLVLAGGSPQLHSPDTYTIVLFECAESERGPRTILDKREVAGYNTFLREDRKWKHLESHIKENIDNLFGTRHYYAFGEFVTTVYAVGQDGESLLRIGMGVVYHGPPNDDVEVAVAEAVDYAFACVNVDKRCRITLSNEAVLRRVSAAEVRHSLCACRYASYADDDAYADDEEMDPQDTFGWIGAMADSDPELPSARSYDKHVEPDSVNFDDELSVAATITRETLHRLRNGEFDDLVKIQREPKYMYVAKGCCSDAEETFTVNISSALRAERSWLLEERMAVSRSGFGACCITLGDGASSSSGRTARRLPGESSKTFAKIVRGEEPPDDTIAWYLSDYNMWLCRSRKKGRQIDRGDHFALGQTPEVRITYVDPFRERIVACSNMREWITPRCFSVSEGITLNTRRYRSSHRAPDPCIPIPEEVPKETRDKIERHAQNAPPRPFEELCLIVFVGNTMCPASRRFFSSDVVNIPVLKEEMATAVMNIGNYSNRGSYDKEMMFVFALASVCCDKLNGARVCNSIIYALGGVAPSLRALFETTNNLIAICDDMAAAGIWDMHVVEAVPEVGPVPCRFVMEFTNERSNCMTPKIVHCRYYSSLPLHCEEARIRGSQFLTRIPSQEDFVKQLTRCCNGRRTQYMAGRFCLGLFFPIKGIRLLTPDIKRSIGEYVFRFREWFEHGPGSVHYDALRCLVPLCECYMADVSMNSNFYGHGILIHLHCIPPHDRELAVVTVLARAFQDAQLYPSCSSHVDVVNHLFQ
ncbi:protein LORF5 [Columbid alphaherpesvirus 1]|uniref:Protein LORF5 n=1 Tax=Columbid alphaherpesvirus 1 TaxID=93386 RepID=A0A1V0M8K1_9ALPH|nr:protein LORF5 [Columbid alphaherpesvirus 1]ARD71387.1 protein LORF5 [Columbid alphaherpesvirus 1]